MACTWERAYDPRPLPSKGSAMVPPFLADIAVAALLGGSAVGFFLFCIRPQLAARGARTAAYAVTAGASGLALAFVVVDALIQLPTVLLAVPILLLVAAWISPDELVGLTGGPQPVPPEVDAVFTQAIQAWECIEVGDVDGAAAAIDGLERLRTPATDHYVELWRQFMTEERARRSGHRVSSRSTRSEIQAEASRLRASEDPLSPGRAWAVVGLAAIIGAAPAVYTARACIGVELLLPTQATEFTDAAPPFLDDPEPGARLVTDVVLDLEDEASSRHDPDAHQQLVDAGFVIAYHRVWQTSIGDQIEASESSFEDAAGALYFHQQVNRYACGFSNEAFAGPGDAVGLQVRYGSGPHPIVEQVSWVLGARRYVVSVGTAAAPADHERVRNLAQRVVKEQRP